MRNLTILFYCIIISCLCVVKSSNANSGEAHLMKKKWSFEGVFGKFDKNSIQRGYQVYREVCSACHSMNRVYFRSLQEVGFSEKEVKQLASEYQVEDGPNDNGEMFKRAAKPSDAFPAPYANEKAARAVNNGAYPPDLSLIVKARVDGANYVYSLLHGYEKAPEKVVLGPNMSYNKYFPGNQIAMVQPLSEGNVTYQDGTQASLDNMAADVVNFLQWASEPEMERRKMMGIKALTFLFVMTAAFFFAKKKVWRGVD